MVRTGSDEDQRTADRTFDARSPRHDPTLPISAVSTMMSLRTMFDAEAADGLTARVGFVFGDRSFVATIANADLTSERTEIADCDVAFEGEPAAVIEYVYGKRPLADMEAEGRLSVTGDRALAERFQTFFGLPERRPRRGCRAGRRPCRRRS